LTEDILVTKKKAVNSLKYMFNLFLKIGEDDSPVQDKKK